MMKRFAIWLSRRTGAYNEIYFKAWRDVGQQMATDRLWWHQSKVPAKNAVANAFHLYSKSLFFGYRPNMQLLVKDVEQLGNTKHDEIKAQPYVKDVANTKLELVAS